MKAVTAPAEQFLTDAKGQRTGVVLDLATYERLREAEEELADIQAYEKARPQVMAALAAGEFCTLDEYRARRM